MSGTSREKRPSVFSRWLRTGRLPLVRSADGLELKFNPWHDPADGRFTFAGSGQRYGPGGASDDAPDIGGCGGARPPRVATKTAPVQHAAQPSGASEAPRAADGRPRPASDRQRDRPNPVVEFIGGVGGGLFDASKDAVEGVRDVLTTNPLTTARNIGLGAAGLVDAAIAAENTPALTHIARARDTLAKASAREIGHATGSTAGNVALAVAPGAALSKAAALRRLRMTPPRPTFEPPQIGWVKENLNSTMDWKLYNDGTDGARPGFAPTLIRTLPNGSKRPVKFDGVRGDYLIDRKWSISRWPSMRAQLLRQSHVLAEHRLIGVLEVPNAKQKREALKLIMKMKIVNFHVRIVEP